MKLEVKDATMMAKWHGCGSSEAEVGIPGPGLAVCSASHSFTLRFKSVRSARVCHGADLVLTFKLKRSSCAGCSFGSETDYFMEAKYKKEANKKYI